MGFLEAVDRGGRSGSGLTQSMTIKESSERAASKSALL